MLQALLSGGVWNGFLLSKAQNEDMKCRFCGALDGHGHLFWNACLELRDSPEFASLMRWDRTDWSRCLLWHGWLPGLSSCTVGSPWAVAASDLACNNLEKALGPYPVGAKATPPTERGGQAAPPNRREEDKTRPPPTTRIRGGSSTSRRPNHPLGHFSENRITKKTPTEKMPQRQS